MSKIVVIFVLLWAGLATADQLPNCVDSQGQNLAVDNQTAIQWKYSTSSQFHGRAHIQGTIARIYRDATGHHHYEAQLGNDTIEVVYDERFGPVPAVHVGSEIEACGDYVNTSGERHPSPDGALIHWVHISDTPQHPSGFMVVDGVLCGQQLR